MELLKRLKKKTLSELFYIKIATREATAGGSF